MRVLLGAKAQLSHDGNDGPQELKDAIEGCHVEASFHRVFLCFQLSREAKDGIRAGILGIARDSKSGTGQHVL